MSGRVKSAWWLSKIRWRECAMLSAFCSAVSSSSGGRSLTRPLGSPIRAVAPPTCGKTREVCVDSRCVVDWVLVHK